MRAMILVLLSFAVPQTHVPVKTTVQIRVLKVERIKGNEDGNLWYTIKLVVRDKERLYHLESQCISSNAQSEAYCGNLSVPHAGATANVAFYDGIFVQFGDDKRFFEVSSEEVPDCK